MGTLLQKQPQIESAADFDSAENSSGHSVIARHCQPHRHDSCLLVSQPPGGNIEMFCHVLMAPTPRRYCMSASKPPGRDKRLFWSQGSWKYISQPSQPQYFYATFIHTQVSLIEPR